MNIDIFYVYTYKNTHVCVYVSISYIYKIKSIKILKCILLSVYVIILQKGLRSIIKDSKICILHKIVHVT